MQKACIAIIFALTLSCVAGTYTVSNDGWAKTPVKIIEDTDANFTNATNLVLGGLTTSDVNVIAFNLTPNTANTTSSTWTVWTKAVDTKALTAGANTSTVLKAPLAAMASYAYGYAYTIEMSNTQLYLYQTKLAGAAELPRVQVTNNANATYNVSLVGAAANTKTLFVFFQVSSSQVNFTSIPFGGAATGKVFSLTTTVNTTTAIDAAAGEALSATQVYASWLELGVLKGAVVDFGSGTLIGLAALANWNKDYICVPYATDKKLYGVWCPVTVLNGTISTTTVYASSSNTTLTKIFAFDSTTTKIVGNAFPYANYLGFFYSNGSVSTATVLSYDIWNLETGNATKSRTTYLTYDKATAKSTTYRIPGAGIYGLVYNFVNTVNGTVTTNTKSTIFAGQILGGSYLTSVFGFLLTIIAGLFLF